MLDEKNTGLIVIDIQGKLAQTVYQSDVFLARCEQLIRAAGVLSLPTLWLEQAPEKLGPTASSLQPLIEPDALITKNTFDACQNEQFLKAIEHTGKKQWLICGIEAHICVYQTSLALLALGYTVLPVSDAISSRAADNKHLALANLRGGGASITSVEMCLYQLMGNSKHPSFGEILSLIK